MVETHASETLIDFQQIARPYIPEDRTLHYHHCENLKSCKILPKLQSTTEIEVRIQILFRVVLKQLSKHFARTTAQTTLIACLLFRFPALLCNIQLAMDVIYIDVGFHFQIELWTYLE
jgi:hypothetical protein